MDNAFHLAVWYAATLLPGLLGYRILLSLNLDSGQAWAGARVAGLCTVTLVAWWSGVLGLRQWLPVGVGLLAAGVLYACWTIEWKRLPWRRLLGMEAVFLAGFIGFLLIRWSHPEIRGTEKPMDYAILNALLRTSAFPPEDFWLAGYAFPYYYWGQLIWTIPIELTGLSSEYAYNLAVATVCGLIAALSWSVARTLGASSKAAAMSVFLNLFAGTPDGLRQLLVSRGGEGIDLWRSSRQVENAITEYPLFTAWLGDLHAHFLVLPVFLTTIVLLLQLRRGSGSTSSVISIGVCLGIASMINPWSLPVLSVLVAALGLGCRSCLPWRLSRARAVVVYLLIVFAGALAISFPFSLYFDPPFGGLKLSRARTDTTELLFYAGALVVPLMAFLYRSLARRDESRHGDNTRTLVAAAAVVMAAAVSGRPVTILLLAALGVVVWLWLREPGSGMSSALVISGVGISLLVAPEIVYVDDPYTGSLQRMNTVFKSYFQAWILLALVVPFLIERAWTRASVPAKAFALIVLVSIPHLSAALLGRPGVYSGLDGLGWMRSGDRGIVDYLRKHGKGAVVVESVGPAYSSAGRISAATGQPALLGWAHHESLWRGEGIAQELARRASVVEAIYSSADTGRIRVMAARENIEFVVIGTRENALFSDEALRAIESSGKVVFRHREARVVQF